MTAYSLKEGNTEVLIHASTIEDGARKQVEAIARHPAIHGLVSIMPDVHAGAGCVIGFTGKFRNAVIPNIVGVDIGCGVCVHELGKIDIDFEAFDEYAREHIPLGFNSHENSMFLKPLKRTLVEDAVGVANLGHYWFTETKAKMSTLPLLQLGTLGGGNHFIEIDEDSDGNRYLAVHCGSRNFGLKVANHYQSLAKKLCDEMMIEVPTGLEYLPLRRGGHKYRQAMILAQKYAQINRRVITEILLRFFKKSFDDALFIESVHNYWSMKDNVVRKGAISAHEGEKLVIPLNMAEGIILGTGKGNPSYNLSAPHGAGRTTGRKAMQRKLAAGEVTLEAFQESMQGVFSTCVDKDHIDESPFAYKSFESISDNLKESVDIDRILKPVYNLKG